MPYRLQIGQGLSETDKENCLPFAKAWKEKLEEYPNFSQYIVLSDEYSFLLHGAENKQNCRI